MIADILFAFLELLNNDRGLMLFCLYINERDNRIEVGIKNTHESPAHLPEGYAINQ